MTESCSIVVLISGNGSNLQALIDQRQSGGFEISAVICNEPDAYGLQRAANAGIPTVVLNHRDYADRMQFDTQLISRIEAFAPDLLVLAGYMRILSAGFVQHYRGRILNIHPSLLPAYRGTNTHQRVLDAGDSVHGVSVHFVTEELDGGPVVLQMEIPVAADDSKESLARRIAEQEHRIYPEVVSWFCRGRLKMHNNTVTLDNKLLPEFGIRRTAS
jgi:phosphoribosylglycinamide formyltransferase-1